MTTLPPVCILTAGKGTRMGELGSIINKALLPLDHQAVLSHIINGFPKGTEFIIALGYQADQVKDYLSMAHPETPVRFVEVDLLEGEGSGPGYSLYCCRSHLLRPFYFVSCDTLFDTDFDQLPEGNWIGVAKVDPDLSDQYCNVAISGNSVTSIRDKVYCDDNHRAFTGFLFVQDFESFWSGLSSSQAIANERQVSNGLRNLVSGPGLSIVEGKWTDVGDEEKYKAAVAERTEYDFGKTDEFLYFVDQRVIKFFSDSSIVSGRVKKAAIRPDAFPKIVKTSSQFYCYDLMEGKTLYARNDPVLFRSLLDWLHGNVWKPTDVEPEHMRQLCRKFYHDKTMERLAKFDIKYPDYKEPVSVNGEPVRPLKELLAELDWESLFNGIPVFVHGDLQFDNILHDVKKKCFVLLDWRQEFAGEIAFGDIYYDLAKLMGGIILNYDYIKAGLFRVESHGNDKIVDFARRYHCMTFERDLERFIIEKGWDPRKVRLLVALIYLNMAPLHHPPFDKALYALGTLFLTRLLNNPS